MINELYDLSKALKSARVQTQNWYRKYRPIPNIRGNAPCVRIIIADGRVVHISNIDPSYSQILRKYGSNQGSYPCMNLAPLYRVTDESVKKELTDIRDHPERIDESCISKMKTWCTDNNWGRKFQSKYKISMKSIPEELLPATGYVPLQTLLDETNFFTNAPHLHGEMERIAWELLEQREHTSLALAILFYQGKPDRQAEDDYGSLSVAFDSTKLIDEGTPAVSEKFVLGLNSYLLDIKSNNYETGEASLVDAFGIPFQTIEEPMPNVKLAGGFDVTLRTMFKEQYCQTRYGKIENAGYPISLNIRKKLQAALEWIGSPEQKNKTWINTEKNEILFVYPFMLRDIPISYTTMFRRSGNSETTFSTQAKLFIQELRKTKEPGTDTHAKGIRIFVLRKIDKARTKVVYTKQTDSDELEKCSEEWTLGCANLPTFPFGIPDAIFPLEAADVLNRFWKQNGEIATDKFKPFSKYHGIEILMDTDLPVHSDLHRLSENAMTIGSFCGNLCANHDWDMMIS